MAELAEDMAADTAMAVDMADFIPAAADMVLAS